MDRTENIDALAGVGGFPFPAEFLADTDAGMTLDRQRTRNESLG